MHLASSVNWACKPLSQAKDRDANSDPTQLSRRRRRPCELDNTAPSVFKLQIFRRRQSRVVSSIESRSQHRRSRDTDAPAFRVWPGGVNWTLLY